MDKDFNCSTISSLTQCPNVFRLKGSLSSYLKWNVN